MDWSSDGAVSQSLNSAVLPADLIVLDSVVLGSISSKPSVL